MDRGVFNITRQEQSMVFTSTERMTEAEYRRFALGDTAGQWELVHGQLREKPGMSVRHAIFIMRLLELLLGQLDRRAYGLSTTHARLRRSADTYCVPDIVVIPAALQKALLEHPDALDAYANSLPLVVEVWSPSTGRYDILEKLPDYQARGDREIWYVHPREQSLTAWRRRPDGTYEATLYRGGIVRPTSLPTVAIDLDELFAL